MGRIEDGICRIINNEASCEWEPHLLSISISSSAQEEFGWIFLEFTKYENQLKDEFFIKEFFPFNDGEQISFLIEGKLYKQDTLLRDVQNAKQKDFDIPGFVADEFTSYRKKPVLFLKILQKDVPFHIEGLKREILKKTFYGSSNVPYWLAGKNLMLKVGAQKDNVVTNIKKSLFEFDYKDSLCFCFEGEENKSFHIELFTCNGRFCYWIDVSKVFELINTPIQDYYGFNVKTNLYFEIFTSVTFNQDTFLDELGKNELAINKLKQRMQAKIIEEKKEILKRVTARKTALSSRKKIYKNGKRLGFVPTNEVETIMLACKLEPYLSSVFPDFEILEHTAQMGIDSLLKIKVDEGESLQDHACLEFEYNFSNFFSHKHPIQHTDYIICWSLDPFKEGEHFFGEGRLSSIEGPYRMKLSRKEWYYVVHVNDKIIRVLPLEKVPGLVLKSD